MHVCVQTHTQEAPEITAVRPLVAPYSPQVLANMYQPIIFVQMYSETGSTILIFQSIVHFHPCIQKAMLELQTFLQEYENHIPSNS